VNATAPAGFSPIVKLCAAGAATPTCALNESALGAAVKVEAAPVTANDTGIDIGELLTVYPDEFAPVAVTMMCPVRLPAASPLAFTQTLAAKRVCPLAGVTVSHDESELSTTGNGPLGVVSSTDKAWQTGADPTAPVNDSALGVATIT
jgi:hypothetical protein